MRDPEASVEVLVRRHQAAVWRYLRCLGCDPRAAEELAVDVFVVAARRDVVDGPGVGGWLRRTARNLWLESLRRSERRREEALADVVDARWEQQGDDGGARLEALRACVGALEARSRTALQLAYDEGASRSVIGDALGLAENGVKTLMQRLRKVLRECVERRLS